MVECYCLQIQDMIKYFFHIDLVDRKYLRDGIDSNFIFPYPRGIKAQSIYLIQFFVNIRDVRNLDNDGLEKNL